VIVAANVAEYSRLIAIDENAFFSARCARLGS
jgi:hypothetical protein